jgi:hypothetical protein
MRFRKKPVVIEAVRFEGMQGFPGRPPCVPSFGGMLADWLADSIRNKTIRFLCRDNALAIKTLEGEMVVMAGDWIIRGVKGELYPCKPDIFEATYEPAGVEYEPNPNRKVQIRPAEDPPVAKSLSHALGLAVTVRDTGEPAVMMLVPTDIAERVRAGNLVGLESLIHARRHEVGIVMIQYLSGKTDATL